MIKHIFPLIATLLIAGCNKSDSRNVLSGIGIKDSKEIAVSNRYNRQRLQIVLDSLQSLDIRNSIKPQLDIYESNKNWFTVNMFEVITEDNNNQVGESLLPRFQTGSMKNWLLIHALNLANVISACSYNRDAYVGIHYIGEDGRVYYTSIINLSWPNPYVCGGSTAHGWNPGTGLH
jgi:hypothetical protein